MKNAQVTLQRLTGGDYRITKISGLIVLTCDAIGKDICSCPDKAHWSFRAGDVVTERQAAKLNQIYKVTVLAVQE